jgi:tetratricopeptide (TPR) repeat protein
MIRPTLLFLLVAAVASSPSFAAEPALPAGYAFTQSPLATLDQLNNLPNTKAPALTTEERKLLTLAWDRAGQPSQHPRTPPFEHVLEAMLFASDVVAEDDRAKVRKQIVALAEEAKKAVAQAKTPQQMHETLLRFLHQGVFKGGRKEGQSRVDLIFRSNQFNRVSACALYYLIAAKLGADLRVFHVPTEDTATQLHLEVEIGTKTYGLDPTLEDGFHVQPPRRNKAQETNGFGLAACIYSNEGTAANRPTALKAYLSALALDPTHPNAKHNLVGTFINWGPELAKDNQHTDAFTVLAFARKLAPQSAELAHNERVIWRGYIRAAIEKENPKAAIERHGLARAALGAQHIPTLAKFYGEHANRLRKDNWDAALHVLENGLKHLPTTEHPALHEERIAFHRVWSQQMLEKKDISASLEVLVKLNKLVPEHPEVSAGLFFHAQETLRLLANDHSAISAQFLAMRKAFPKSEQPSQAAKNFLLLQVKALCAKKQFEAAAKLATTREELLLSKSAREEIGGVVYWLWAEHFAKNSEWESALAKYEEGLKLFPENRLLAPNAVLMIDAWVSNHIEKQNWKAASDVYSRGLKLLPESDYLKARKQFCETK